MSTKMLAAASQSLMNRYSKFLDSLDDPNQEPVTVFQPLSPRQLAELHLIREVSMELQEKKEEDVRKAAEAAAETAKVPEEKKDNSEETSEAVDEQKTE